MTWQQIVLAGFVLFMLIVSAGAWVLIRMVKETWICTICGFIGNTKEEYDRHMAIGKHVWPCGMCGRNFQRREQYVSHLPCSKST